MTTRRCLSSLLLVAVLPTPANTAATGTASSSARRRTTQRRRRRHEPTSIGISTRAPKLITRAADADDSREALKERWVDILSLEHADDYNSVRLENQREQQYFYEVELLADQLLGLHDNASLSQSKSRRGDSLLSKELSILWKTIAIASSTLLLGIPLLSLFNNLVASNLVQNTLSTIQSTITPYLLPTLSLVSSSIHNYFLQAQAIVHSMPYFLKHMHRIKIRPWPLLYKLIRKCIILEAWRHIWMRVYKGTRYLWRGTLKGAKGAYVRVFPAWIRRGVKSMFQSMVQAQVHGAVGGFVGSALSGVTFESWAWSSSSGGDSVVESDALAESMTTSAAQGLESTIQDAIDSVATEETIEAITESVVDLAVEEAVESIISQEAVDAISESMGSAVEDAMESIISEEAVDAISESMGSAFDDAMESIISDDTVNAMVEIVETSLGDAMESIVDDCLSEGGCVDQIMESVVD